MPAPYVGVFSTAASRHLTFDRCQIAQRKFHSHSDGAVRAECSQRRRNIARPAGQTAKRSACEPRCLRVYSQSHLRRGRDALDRPQFVPAPNLLASARRETPPAQPQPDPPATGERRQNHSRPRPAELPARHQSQRPRLPIHETCRRRRVHTTAVVSALDTAASAFDSSSVTLAIEINSAGTYASSNAFRICGRQSLARPLPAAGFTNTTAGNKEEMGLASDTRFAILPNSLCVAVNRIAGRSQFRSRRCETSPRIIFRLEPRARRPREIDKPPYPLGHSLGAAAAAAAARLFSVRMWLNAGSSCSISFLKSATAPLSSVSIV